MNVEEMKSLHGHKKKGKSRIKQNAVLTAYLNTPRTTTTGLKKKLWPHSCARQRGEQSETKVKSESEIEPNRIVGKGFKKTPKRRKRKQWD